MRMRLIALNGPPGSGKTWVSNKLVGPDSDHLLRGTPRKAVNSSDCLFDSARALVGAPSGMSRTVFKETAFLGRTGREWMIHLSEDFAKKWDIEFFGRVAYETMLREASVRSGHQILFTNDSVSFEDEFLFFRTRSDLDVLGVCIEPPGYGKSGERWQEDDSRYNLSHMCEIVAPDSSAAYEKTIMAMQRRGWI